MSSSTASPFRSALGWLLFPFFICLLLFWLIPLSSGVVRSLYADPAAIVSSSTAPSSTALTLKNYTDLVHDGQYWKALKNTFVYGVASVLIILPLAFVLAHWLKRSHRRLRPLLTFGLMVPGLTPPVILGILFLMVFHGRYGVLNSVFVDPVLTVLQSFGWIEQGPTQVNWLKDPAFIMPAMILQGVWRWTGFVALFFLCGLEAIPVTYYEAARLEGAGPLHRMRYVSFPYLKPVIAFSAIYLLIDAFAMFSGAYSLLGGSGGTDDAGLLLVSYAYFTGFKFHEPASAAAISMSVVPLMMVIIWAILFGTSRREVAA